MKARPHVALALEYPIAYGGGVSVIVQTLLEALREDFRFSLISPDGPDALEQAGLGWLEHHLSWQRARASRARACALAETLVGWGVELAHFHCGGIYGWGNRRPGTSPLPSLRSAGVRCLTTVHLVTTLLGDVLPPNSPWWKEMAALPVAWAGKMQALAATEMEIAVSQENRRQLRRWYWPLAGRFRAVYHSRLPAAPPPAGEAREKIVLHVGHRAERKGQHLLLEAFARLAPRFPGWSLVLIGPSEDASFEARLRESVRVGGLEKQVKLMGPAPGAEWMRRAAIYVQPALHEGLPLALAEAMFYGCACLGTRTGGVPELIASEADGLLAPPGDVDALAAALERLLTEENLRVRLSITAPRAILERGMTAPSMAEAHARLYREVLGE